MNTDIYISITSIFDNQNLLLKTLQSILLQTLLPTKCFIYLSEEKYLLDDGFINKTIYNSDLHHLITNNNHLFQIIWTKNDGPYRKLLPLLKDKYNEDPIIITIDDDTEYVNTFIEDLVNLYYNHNCCIANLGFTMDNTLNNIVYNKQNEFIQKSIFNFHKGKGGVLYKPSFFYKTKNIIFDNNIYNECCKTNDDIWFNFLRIANNIECYLTNNKFMNIDNTNKNVALYSNFNINNNTKNINLTINKLKSLNYLKFYNHTISNDTIIDDKELVDTLRKNYVSDTRKKNTALLLKNK